jgi:hypothetical protein
MLGLAVILLHTQVVGENVGSGMMVLGVRAGCWTWRWLCLMRKMLDLALIVPTGNLSA